MNVMLHLKLPGRIWFIFARPQQYGPTYVNLGNNVNGMAYQSCKIWRFPFFTIMYTRWEKK